MVRDYEGPPKDVAKLPLPTVNTITALWLVLNILCVAGTAIKLIFMYL